MPLRLAKRVGSGKFIWSGRIFRCKRGQTEYALRAVKKTESTKVAVLGASGYTGEELVRLLLRHPQAELVAVTSRQYVGKTVAEVFRAPDRMRARRRCSSASPRRRKSRESQRSHFSRCLTASR